MISLFAPSPKQSINRISKGIAQKSHSLRLRNQRVFPQRICTLQYPRRARHSRRVLIECTGVLLTRVRSLKGTVVTKSLSSSRNIRHWSGEGEGKIDGVFSFMFTLPLRKIAHLWENCDERQSDLRDSKIAFSRASEFSSKGVIRCRRLLRESQRACSKF